MRSLKLKFSKWLAGSHAMLYRIAIPVMAIMLVQAVFYFFIFWHGSVIGYIERNATDSFDNHIESCHQDIENELLHNWMRVSESGEQLSWNVGNTLREYGAQASDIRTDPQLNQAIVENTVDTLLAVLRRNSVNGVFLVLDGPMAAQSQGMGEPVRSGIYIRNLDSNTTSATNDDLLLERGMPGLSKKMGIALDSYWSAGFTFDKSAPERSDYFFKPLEAARAYGVENKNITDFGYWSKAFSLSKNDVRVMTYSLPLIAEDKTVIGVFGIDVTEQHLLSELDYSTLAPNQSGAYFMGICDDESGNFERVTSNGPLYRYHFGNSAALSLPVDHLDGVSVISDAHGCRFLSSVRHFEIYNSNTPFENECWILMGLAEYDTIMSYSHRINRAANLSLAVSLLSGLLAVLVLTKVFTSPITALLNDLRQSDPTHPIHLKKLNVTEIDELTVSIENLSRDVATASEKVARIFSMAQISVGVFEYNRRMSHVFCSSNLYSILNWPERTDEMYLYIERHEFERRMLLLDPKVLTNPRSQLQLTDPDGKIRWMQVDISDQNGTTLGAVTDVTSDMAAKHRIEYERDYDPLTSLYNLRAFRLRFTQLICQHELKTAALIMWDLDNLKHINDSFGHDFGDRYIQAFAQCLELCGRYNAIAARRSGDEFYTFIYGYDSRDEIKAIISEIWKLIECKTISLPDRSEYRIRVSGGLAWYPDDTSAGEELLRFADFAMYNAKHEIKGTIKEFDRSAYLENAYIIDGYEVITRLIEGELVRFAMQPVISVEDGSVFGYEMLMRPQIPGDYTPNDILKMAQLHSKLYPMERLSLFGGMGAFVEMVEKNRIGPSEKVFLNSIGSQMLTKPDMLRFQSMFEPYLHRIVLELTEGEQDNGDYGAMKLDFVNRWNAMLAIDDYGSGYNSEAMMIYLSPHLVKVDMSILRDIDKDINRQSILESIVTYAKKRDVAVLAEGVETRAELFTVIAHGADYIQGFYVGEPGYNVSPIASGVLESIAEARRERDKGKSATI